MDIVQLYSWLFFWLCSVRSLGILIVLIKGQSLQWGNAQVLLCRIDSKWLMVLEVAQEVKVEHSYIMISIADSCRDFQKVVMPWVISPKSLY